MKTFWKKKVERWAAEFLYRLNDEQFDAWVSNIRFWRTARKNLVFTEISKPVHYEFTYGSRMISFPRK